VAPVVMASDEGNAYPEVLIGLALHARISFLSKALCFIPTFRPISTHRTRLINEDLLASDKRSRNKRQVTRLRKRIVE
jgi:hypothetical protein